MCQFTSPKLCAVPRAVIFNASLHGPWCWLSPAVMSHSTSFWVMYFMNVMCFPCIVYLRASGPAALTHWPLRDVGAILQYSFYKLTSWAIPLKLGLGEWYGIPWYVKSQHWLRKWLGAVRHQAITRSSVDPDLCCHVSLLGYNVLTPLTLWFMCIGVLEHHLFR